MKRSLLLSLVVLLSMTTLNARPIDAARAKTIGQRFAHMPSTWVKVVSSSFQPTTVSVPSWAIPTKARLRLRTHRPS